MASPLLGSVSIPLCNLSPPSATRLPCFNPNGGTLHLERLQSESRKLKDRVFVRRATLDESPVLDPPPRFEGTDPESVASLKLKLLVSKSVRPISSSYRSTIHAIWSARNVRLVLLVWDLDSVARLVLLLRLSHAFDAYISWVSDDELFHGYVVLCVCDSFSKLCFHFNQKIMSWKNSNDLLLDRHGSSWCQHWRTNNLLRECFLL